MTNSPTINLIKDIQQTLLSIDPSLSECSCCSSGAGWVSFKMESGTLSGNYPEMFSSGFSQTLIMRDSETFTAVQYFTIGHPLSAMPGLKPAFVSVSDPEPVDEVEIEDQALIPTNGAKATKREMRFGLVDRDISRVRTGGLLDPARIREIAEQVFMAMHLGVKMIPLDYDGVSREIHGWEERNGLWSGTRADDVFLKKQMENGVSEPSWTHLESEGYAAVFHQDDKYIGSILLTAPCSGNLETVKQYIIDGFSNFYSSFRQVVAQYNLPERLT